MTATREPIIGADVDNWGQVLNDFLTAHTSNELVYLGNYISGSASASANLAGVQQAITDTNQGQKPLIGHIGRFPCDKGLLMPPFPLRWKGWGKGLSALIFPAFSAGGQYAVSYDHTSSGHIQNGSPWYDNTSNGLNSIHRWHITGMGFEGSDWTGSSGYGFYFPNWDAGSRTALLLQLDDVAIRLFQGNGILCEINGLVDQCKFNDLNVGANSGTGVVPGSDSFWTNLVTCQNGGWGLLPSDHRNMQVDNWKSWGNGQVDNTCGGGKVIGAMDNLTNVYMQDNYAEGLHLEGDLIGVAGLTCDRNCANSTSHSGLVINNSNGVLVNNYLATDSQRTGHQTHALKVTGSNTDCYVRGVQKVTGADTNVTNANFTESNSGGCTVVNPG